MFTIHGHILRMGVFIGLCVYNTWSNFPKGIYTMLSFIRLNFNKFDNDNSESENKYFLHSIT